MMAAAVEDSNAARSCCFASRPIVFVSCIIRNAVMSQIFCCEAIAKKVQAFGLERNGCKYCTTAISTTSDAENYIKI